MNKILNIVALNIPYPANYGGVIDIYYKIKALQDCGVKVILHCFEYERPRVKELEDICKEVHYYRRKTGFLTNLSFLPYNVYSRKDRRLIDNLLKNDSPVLFEGLHTCYYLNDSRLKNRFKVFRESNIEHDYYREIGKAENNLIKKCFYYLEALRFKRFQSKVAAADLILVVSKTDAAYFQKTFPENKVEFMPSFHGNASISVVPGQSGFILYHGKLSVKENEKAALYLIREIFPELNNYQCIIAGMNPSKTLLKAALKHRHIKIEANPLEEQIGELIRTAQVILLVTFQDTGLKLKLLNSLFAGRNIVVNPMMTTGSGLDELCYIARNREEMIKICNDLMQKPFSEDCLELRKRLLLPVFSDKYRAERLVDLLFN
ncbi:MAG: glycosyltransferase family 4 protein [Tannerella sp.]|jgi:hypothetical protein|nr:glycosyltransferase family 4 protein [Tannerella sp.]